MIHLNQKEIKVLFKAMEKSYKIKKKLLELEKEAQELINEGNSKEKAKGYGIKYVIETLNNKI